MAIGRPRAFDADKALDRALQVFWRKGYEGSSLTELTRAMGINPPSLYAAFGNKEALFRRALDRYSEKAAACMRDCLNAPTAREAVEKLLRETADHLSDPHTPHGCLLVQGALSCGEEADPVRQELAARRRATEAALRERFKRAKVEGDLAAGADPASLARFIATVTQGMAVQAAGGASRKDLRQIAETALHAWPG